MFKRFSSSLNLETALLASITLPCVGKDIGLGDCISGIYSWSLAIVGIAAFLSIVYGAWGVVTAFGNTGKVGEATNRISNAVLGIILLFSSYLILKTINPDLVGGTVNLPKIVKEDQIKNVGSENDLSKIENFDVSPKTADISDNSKMSFKLAIYSSTVGIDKLCPDKTAKVFYKVFTTTPYDILIRIYFWDRAEFGTGKTISRNFDEQLKNGNGGTTLDVKPGTVGYKAEFVCGTKTLNTSSPPVTITAVP